MPLNPPRTLQTLLTGDSASSRAFQNVKSAVDPVLGFINNGFQVANDGSMAFLRKIKTFAADSIVANSSLVANGPFTANASTTTNGALNANNGMAVKGASTVKGTQVIQKLDDGTQGSQLVQGNLTVLGTTSSSTGFKCERDAGYAYGGSAVANTRYQTKRATTSDAGSASFNAPILFQPQFPGSFLAIHGYSLGTAGGNFNILIFKSATQVPSTGTPWLTGSAMNASQYFGTGQTFSKGTYSFAAGDYFCFAIVWTTGGNQHVQVTLSLEYGA